MSLPPTRFEELRAFLAKDPVQNGYALGVLEEHRTGGPGAAAVTHYALPHTPLPPPPRRRAPGGGGGAGALPRGQGAAAQRARRAQRGGRAAARARVRPAAPL